MEYCYQDTMELSVAGFEPGIPSGTMARTGGRTAGVTKWDMQLITHSEPQVLVLRLAAGKELL